MLISDIKYYLDCVGKKCKVDSDKWGTNNGIIVDVEFINKYNSFCDPVFFVLINEDVKKLSESEFEIDYKNSYKMAITVVCNKCGEKEADGLFKFDFKNKSIEYLCSCGELNIIASQIGRSDVRTLPRIKFNKNR